MTCDNARDSITTDAGKAVNFVTLGDDQHMVKSFCRTEDGTWVAWINEYAGDEEGDNSNKGQWAIDIASLVEVSVGFFPDNGGAPVVYNLGLNAPCWDWFGITRYSDLGADPRCVIRSVGSLNVFGGIYFAPNPQSELHGWFTQGLDLQIRTDGANVWVVALARESTMYPYLTTYEWFDNCGARQPSMRQDAGAEGLVVGGDGDPFAHDTTADEFGSTDPFWFWSDNAGNAQDDGGPHISFRWQPARVTVWGGDIGGFEKLGTVEAVYNNCEGYGLCGPVEAAASPAEPGVLHVLWAEGGYAGIPDGVGGFFFDNADCVIGQRIVYSRWDTGGKTIENELARIDESGFRPHEGDRFNVDWVWTADYILRNDHGSPIAFVAGPWLTDTWDDGATPGGKPLYPQALEAWDLSSGSAVVLQTLAPSLYPTPAETGIPGDLQLSGVLVNPGGIAVLTATSDPARAHFASSLYTDPTLGNQDVYLLCVGFNGDDLGGSRVTAFYRIPCDASATFDYMDGIRKVGYSITAVPPDIVGSPIGGADFVSDTRNVWIPAGIGGVYQLPRLCEKTWQFYNAFPGSTTFPFPFLDNWVRATFVEAARSVPAIVTDAGGDWLAGAGVVPVPGGNANFPVQPAALRAKICRCCIPCAPLEIRTWHKTS